MSFVRLKQMVLWGLMLFCAIQSGAHPTGSMLYTGNALLWSYVCADSTEQHISCVMVWDEQGGVREWLRSEHAASDWLFAQDASGTLYFVERYFDSASNQSMYRLLKAKTPLAKTEPMTNWAVDDWRFGEAGFIPLASDRFLFARYPHVYEMQLGEPPVVWLHWKNRAEVDRLISVDAERMLVKAPDQAWALSHEGPVLRHWSSLLQPDVSNLPFMGNRIFDMALQDNELWLAYWGGRRIDVIDEDGRRTIKTFAGSYLPHAITATEDAVYFLASTINPGAEEDIVPLLFRYREGTLTLLWGDEESVND